MNYTLYTVGTFSNYRGRNAHEKCETSANFKLYPDLAANISGTC